MACLSQLKDCNVHVYERTGPQYKRISAFDHPVDPEKKPVIRVLYCGGVHYGEIIVCSATAAVFEVSSSFRLFVMSGTDAIEIT